jgi:uncharacterized protein YegL
VIGNHDARTVVKRPGGEIASRPLDFFWLCDTSGSMAGAKVERLNFAIADAVPAMRRSADDNPQSRLFVRAIAFDDDARWVVEERTPVREFNWRPLQVKRGLTAMGSALALVASQLKSPPFPAHYWPPVIVLVTDGRATDGLPGQPDFEVGLRILMDEPGGRDAIRLGIAIGEDADLGSLTRFIGDPSIQPLQAKTAADLVQFIRWSSTASIARSSAPRGASGVDEESAFRPRAVPIPRESGDLPESWESEML